MESRDLFLKCYAERTDDQWTAICLDYDLAVQADTLDEAKSRLHAVIADYLRDALVGEDKEYADQLLNRRAPAYMFAKWHVLHAMSRLRRLSSAFRDHCVLFVETMPLKPV